MIGPRLTFALALTVSAAAPLAAQTTAPPTGSPSTIPEKQSATPLQDGRSDSLSGKLNKSGGVIAPRDDIDPGIHKAAPDPRPNSTPVIPPSATGGGSAK